jgi:hypothetical protein
LRSADDPLFHPDFFNGERNELRHPTSGFEFLQPGEPQEIRIFTSLTQEGVVLVLTKAMTLVSQQPGKGKVLTHFLEKNFFGRRSGRSHIGQLAQQ